LNHFIISKSTTVMDKHSIKIITLICIFWVANLYTAFAQNTIPAGTPIILELTETLHSSTLTTGQEVTLKVTQDLRLNEVIVVQKGSLAKGRIIIADTEFVTEVRIFIEPFVCTALDGQEIALGGPAAVFDKEEDRTEVVIKEGTAIPAEIYSDFIVQNDQEPDPLPTEAVIVEDGALVLPAGLDIELSISDEVVLSELEQGDPIRLRVKADVLLGETIVIRAKAPAEGFIKRISGNRVYIMPANVTAIDGKKLLLESDRSTLVTLDQDQEDEVQALSGDIKAMLAAECQVVGR
jgi:hypothetical protein